MRLCLSGRRRPLFAVPAFHEGTVQFLLSAVSADGPLGHVALQAVQTFDFAPAASVVAAP